MPSVSNLFRPGGLRWAPDADSVNAPEGVLLRADNLVPDVGGTQTLRQGSSILYTHDTPSPVHSLHTVELADGVTHRCHGVGDVVYINGTPQAEVFDGSGDIAMGDDSYQVFVARGKTKRKWDGTTWNPWGLKAPIAPPDLAAIASITSTVATFATGESPAVNAIEGTVAFTTDYAGTANQAIALTPDISISRGTISKLFTTDQNFFSIANVEGSEADLFDVYLKLGNPRDIESISIYFGVGDSSTTPFMTDRFEFTFDFTKTKAIPMKDFESEGYGAYGQAVTKALAAIRPEDVTGIRTPEQVKKILSEVGQVPSPNSSMPTDAQTWGHLTVSRGQFKRIGSTASRGWDTVRGLKILVKTRKGTAPVVTFADGMWIGGGARCLTGEYRCVIQAVRNFGPYYELSPPSPPSPPINLNHQTLELTVNGTTLNALDPQADSLWVYLFGGWLDQYYRFAVVPAQINTGMTIDELSTPAGSDMNDAVKRMRIPSWGYTYTQTGTGTFDTTSVTSAGVTATVTTDGDHVYSNGDLVWVRGATQTEYNGVYAITVTGTNTFTYTFAGSATSPATGTIIVHSDSPVYGDGEVTGAAANDLVITLRTSELEALLENYKLDSYLAGPPDDIVGIAGPWKSRMFCLTEEGYVYPSSNKSPSVFNTAQVIDLTRYGNAFWIARTGSGVYVGMEKDVVYIAGSGDNTTDIAVDLYPEALNVGNPPVDSCYWVDGNSIMYRSCDGPVILTGGSIQPVPFNGTSLLWRGQARHGVAPLNTTTGRFRMAADGFQLYLLAPEGSVTSSNVIYRYSLEEKQWSRQVFDQVGAFHSILTEPNGTLVAGDDVGRVWELESSRQDNGVNISPYVLSPISDGGQPLVYKDAVDFQIQCDTNSDLVTVNLYKDGASTASVSYDVLTTSDGAVFRGSALDLSRFLRAQMELTGSCSGLIVYSFNLSYRVRPQHVMVLDTGYFEPEEPGDLLWLYEVEFDAICAAAVTMQLYINDVLKHTATVTPEAYNVRDVVQVPLPRGTKGERCRLVFSTTNDDGEGYQGFDPYSVRVRASSSGNQHARRYIKVFPAGSAP